MGLFGYFVDDISTARAIPFCRYLVYLAVASNDARLKMFILDNLLPCLIQRLDSELPCSIQRLRSELTSCGSNNGTKDLTVLCHEIYDCMLNCGNMQTEASHQDLFKTIFLLANCVTLMYKITLIAHCYICDRL